MDSFCTCTFSWNIAATSLRYGKPSQITKFLGPTWGQSGSYRPQMGPMLASGTLLSGTVRPDCYSHRARKQGRFGRVIVPVWLHWKRKAMEKTSRDTVGLLIWNRKAIYLHALLVIRRFNNVAFVTTIIRLVDIYYEIWRIVMYTGKYDIAKFHFPKAIMNLTLCT